MTSSRRRSRPTRPSTDVVMRVPAAALAATVFVLAVGSGCKRSGRAPVSQADRGPPASASAKIAPGDPAPAPAAAPDPAPPAPAPVPVSADKDNPVTVNK